jgi:hypothetical protein
MSASGKARAFQLTQNVLAAIGVGTVLVGVASPLSRIYGEYQASKRNDGSAAPDMQDIPTLRKLASFVHDKYRRDDDDALLFASEDVDDYRAYFDGHRAEFTAKEEARQAFMGRFIAETGLVGPPSAARGVLRELARSVRAPPPAPNTPVKPSFLHAGELWSPGAVIMSRPSASAAAAASAGGADDDADASLDLVEVDSVFRRHASGGDEDAWVPVHVSVRPLPAAKAADELLRMRAGLPHGLSLRQFRRLERS